MPSLQDPASQGKPKLGETNGDREYLMQVLRAATARAKLISNTLDSIGMALRQRAVSVEDAMRFAHILICSSSVRPPRSAAWRRGARHDQGRK
jgi:hypothetical protein